MVTSGLRLMFWGFIKKVVIADRLALYCNEVYSNNSYHGWPVLLAIIFFAFQIYCDFSGYSDIAIGAARVMGFRLMQNFNQPYLSASISEFWKRWHISLSTWFRDYLYISLGGNRVNITRLYFNLFITFLVSGLWHGANWTFIIWGALNGLYIILELSLKPFGARLPGVFRSRPVNILITFTLINFSWVFFRSKSVAEAVHVIGSVFPLGNIRSMAIEHFNIKDILFALASIVALEIVTFINGKHNLGDFLANQKKWIQWTVYYGGLALVFLFGVYNNTQFIYFQF